MLRMMNLTGRRGMTDLSPWELLTRVVNLLSLPWDPLQSLLPLLSQNRI